MERAMSDDRIAVLAKQVFLVANLKMRAQAIHEIEQLLRADIYDAACEMAADMRIRPQDEWEPALSGLLNGPEGPELK
jgi:hypothetical protein